MKRLFTLFVLLGMFVGLEFLSFAGPYDVDEGDVDVTTASTPVLAAKGIRVMLSVQNNSDTTVWCTTNSTTAVVNSATQIFPGGALVYDIVTPTGAVNCIHNGTGTKRVHWKQSK